MKILFIILYAGLITPAGGAEKTQFSEIKAIAETADITGTVDLPPVPGNSGRRFRGSSYRNRGTTNSSDEQAISTNRFLNTVVSAHPVSYAIENLPVSDSVQIIQENATFIPNITPVTVGSTVQFINNDAFYHNVFSLTPGAKFNIGRRPTGDVYSKEIPLAKWKVTGLGPINLFCDIHSQMNAVILSLDTPYFSRVNSDGTYTLEGLPAGRYELKVYNKDFDIGIREIEVSGNETYEVNFNLAS